MLGFKTPSLKVCRQRRFGQHREMGMRAGGADVLGLHGAFCSLRMVTIKTLKIYVFPPFMAAKGVVKATILLLANIRISYTYCTSVPLMKCNKMWSVQIGLSAS